MRDAKLWGSQYGDKPATRDDFIAHAKKRGVEPRELNFGIKADTLEGIADGLAAHSYDWDRAIGHVEYIWAHRR